MNKLSEKLPSVFMWLGGVFALYCFCIGLADVAIRAVQPAVTDIQYAFWTPEIPNLGVNKNIKK